MHAAGYGLLLDTGERQRLPAREDQEEARLV